MGTKLAPSFANLFMGDFEEKFVYSYPIQPFIWKRFIDDIFIIWTYGEDELRKFIEYLNSKHTTIKFTDETSKTSIDFLDITIRIETDNSISTTLFCKPTDSHNYLLFSSEHPRHILKGIPYSQFLRVRRICSKTADFKRNTFMLSTHFIRRGYPKPLILSSLRKSLELNRDTLLNKEALKGYPATGPNATLVVSAPNNPKTNDGKTFYCITTHNPRNPPIKDIVTENWNLVQKTKTTRHLENARLIFGLRRSKNLSDQLVRASTRTMKKGSYISEHPCNRPTLCKYCPKINHTGSIASSNTGKSFHSKKEINCQSSNLIYLITCKHCKIQYVGQTRNRLITRFQGHYYDVKNRNDTTVSRHFNQCPPTHPALFEGFEISVLHFVQCPANSQAGQTERDREEKRWINRLMSGVPRGLNLMD